MKTKNLNDSNPSQSPLISRADLAFVIILCIATSIGFLACAEKKSGLPELTGGQREAGLADAPLVPKRVESNGPQKVVVHLEVQEMVKPIMNGTLYTFWTFGGSVPGKFI